MDEYEYLESEHAICPACSVVRTGPVIVRSMLEWKATERDGRLGQLGGRPLSDPSWPGWLAVWRRWEVYAAG